MIVYSVQVDSQDLFKAWRHNDCIEIRVYEALRAAAVNLQAAKSIRRALDCAIKDLEEATSSRAGALYNE